MAEQQMTIQGALQLGMSHHQSGRLQDAEMIYRQILQQHPENPDATHLLGLIAHQVGQHQPALELILKAIALNPQAAHYYANCAEVYRALGDFGRAVSSCEAALQRDPNLTSAYVNMGSALASSGRHEQAIDALQKALALNPNDAQAHFNIAGALKGAGRLKEALASLEKCINLAPNHAFALCNLGTILKEMGRLDEAIDFYRRSVAANPQHAEAHNNLGAVLEAQSKYQDALLCYQSAMTMAPAVAEIHYNVAHAYQHLNRLDDAVAAYRQAIAIRSDFAEAYGNLGNTLMSLGRMDDALECYHAGLAAKPDWAEGYSNLGAALLDMGRPDEAMVQYDKALSLNPALPQVHWNRSLVLLLRGDFENGFKEHEWRWQCKEFTSPRLVSARPQWRGTDPAGRRILLHCEQGIGDSIQLVRYVKLIAERGGKPLLLIPGEIQKLLSTVEGVVGACSTLTKLPEFDLQVPFLSLPFAFGTRPDTVPANVPYITADASLQRRFAAMMVSAPGSLKVGLTWRGNPKHKNDRFRSMDLATLAPLASAANVTFFSLQKDPGSEQLAAAPAGLKIIDLMGSVNDWTETAAIVANLDLVISVDTAVVHLAGAMGKPTWTLLPANRDWRWMLDRQDTPWYPTMRLFRQGKLGLWDDVVARVGEALQEMACQKAQ